MSEDRKKHQREVAFVKEDLFLKPNSD